MTIPIHILIVEDTPADADLMVMHLAKEGFKVTFQRVETEETYLEALQNPFGLILSDWSLPQFNGMRALELLKSHKLDIPFVLVSGEIGEETAVAIMRQGAADYVLKDRMGRLGQAVKNALEHNHLIIENKKAAEVLADSEAELRALFASIRDVVLVLDRDGVYRKIAPTNPDLLVRPAQEMVGQRLEDIFPQDQARKFNQTIHSVLTTQQTQFIEYKLTIKNRVVWFETSISPISDREVIWVARDITDRRLAEKAQRENEQRLRSVLDNSPDTIYLLDLISGQVSFLNREEFCGYSVDELRAPGSILQEVHSDDLAGVIENWRQIKTTDNLDPIEYRLKRKDGTWAWIQQRTATLSRDLDGLSIQILVTLTDVTARKLAEEALSESEIRYQLISQAASDYMFSTRIGTNGKLILNWTAGAFETITGYSMEEYIARGGWRAALHPDDLTIDDRDMENLRSNQRVISEIRTLKKDSTLLWVRVYAYPVLDDHNELIGIYGAVQDITERKLAEEALTQERILLRTVIDNLPDAIYVKDTALRKILTNHADLENIGKPESQVLGKTDWDVFPAEIASRFYSDDQTILQTGQAVINQEELLVNLDGQSRWLLTSKLPLRDRLGSTSGIVGIGRDITVRKQTAAQIQLQAAALASAANAIVITDRNGAIEWANPAYISLTGYTIAEIVGQNPRILKSGVQDRAFYQNLWNTIMAGQVWHGELVNRRKDGSVYYEEQTITPIRDPNGQISKFIGVKQDITLRKQAESAFTKLLQRQTQVAALGRELAKTRNLTVICREAYRALKHMAGFAYFGVALIIDEKKSLKMLYAILDETEFDPTLFPFLELGNHQTTSVCSKSIHTREPLIISDPSEIWKSPIGMLSDRSQDMLSTCCLPMIAEDQVIGLLELQSPRMGEYLAEDLEWLSVVANQVGLSIQNAKLFAETQQRIAELSALATIDSAVTAHLDPQEIFGIVLEQVTTRLKADAAVLFLFQAQKQMLECVFEIGYTNNSILQMHLHLGESLAGKVALHREILYQNLEVPENYDLLRNESKSEGFKDYYGVPLVADSQLIGVLEILYRSPLSPDRNWLRFMEILTNQAAVAINTTLLYKDIQDSNNELLRAYDLTIEGWSRAMDLRDKETENHTRRVTELTMRLAQRLDIESDQMISIRRGALLHDIGKLGVPDTILLKADRLTDEEWVIMRSHPQLAFEMLYPIEYLRAALDIPYCHHEKWDGTGYPRGLKGEEIPLAARLFALADVYDALASDRPYRKAWSRTQALKYIREQSGRHFDPKIVDVFHSLLQTGELATIK